MLTKSLVKVGNSYAVVLDRTLMDLVGISPEVPVNLQVHGRTLSRPPSRWTRRSTRYSIPIRKSFVGFPNESNVPHDGGRPPDPCPEPG